MIEKVALKQREVPNQPNTYYPFNFDLLISSFGSTSVGETKVEFVDLRRNEAFGNTLPWAILLVDSLPDDDKIHRIIISSKAAFWRYVVRKRNGVMPDKLSIMPTKTGNSAVFPTVDLSEDWAVFQSSIPLPLKQMYSNDQRFQLVEDTGKAQPRVLIQNLPTLGIDSFVKANDQDDKQLYSEVLIYI